MKMYRFALAYFRIAYQMLQTTIVIGRPPVGNECLYCSSILLLKLNTNSAVRWRKEVWVHGRFLQTYTIEVWYVIEISDIVELDSWGKSILKENRSMYGVLLCIDMFLSVTHNNGIFTFPFVFISFCFYFNNE